MKTNKAEQLDTSPEALDEFFRTHPCRTPTLCAGCGREFKTRRGADAHECSRRFKTMLEFDYWYARRGYRPLGRPPRDEQKAWPTLSTSTGKRKTPAKHSRGFPEQT